MVSPFVNITISLMIRKEILTWKTEFIAEGSKDYVTLLLNVLVFSSVIFSFSSARILSFTPPFCDVNFVVFICLFSSLWGLKKIK